MDKNEMTKRDFYNKVIANEITEDVVEFAKAAIVKLDAVNEKRRNTPTKAQKANEEFVAKLVNEILTDIPKTAVDIAAEFGTMTHQKATAIAKAAVEAGLAKVEDVKVAKKGNQKGYTRA